MKVVRLIKSKDDPVNLVKEDLPACDIGGQPVSSSIMMGDYGKLAREREDLYQRISKTVNIDYDPKQVKPFLKQLAKNDQVSNFRPLGLANE